MSARILIAIAFKVFAIYLLAQVVLAVPSIWAVYETSLQWGAGEATLPQYVPYIVGLILVGLGVFMVRLIYTLANSVLESAPEETDSVEISRLEPFVLQILGTLLFIEALNYLSVNGVLVFSGNLYDPGSKWGARLGVAVHLLELLLGISLVVRSDTWRRWFSKLREAGLEPRNKQGL